MARTLLFTPFPHRHVHHLPGNARWLVPGRRAARFLRHPAQTLEQFAHFLLRRHFPGWRLATAIEEHFFLKEALADAGMDGPDRTGRAARFRPLVEELLDLPGPRPSDPRLAAAARLTEAFEARLRDERLIPASALYRWLAEQETLSVLPLVVYGYLELSPGQWHLLNRVASEESHVVMPYLPDSGLEPLRQRAVALASGWTVREASESEAGDLGECLATGYFRGHPPTSDDVVYWNVRSPETEVRAVLGEVKRLLLEEGVSPAEIALTTTDEALYGPLLLRLAGEYGVPVRAFFPIPLARTYVGEWLLLLLEVYVQQWAYEAVVRWLVHPLTRQLDSGHWEHIRREHPEGWTAWFERLKETELAGWLPRLQALQGTWLRSQWLEQLRAFLHPEEIRHRIVEHPREWLAFQELRDQFRLWHRMPERRYSPAELYTELREWLELTAVPAQPGEGGVELHLPMALQGTRYAHVFWLGVTEGRVPRRLVSPQVLDFFDREDLVRQGIPLRDARLQAASEQAILYGTLLSVNARLTLSCPRVIGQQRVTPSALPEVLQVHAGTPDVSLVASRQEYRRWTIPEPAWLGEPDLHRRWQMEWMRETHPSYTPYDGYVGPGVIPLRRYFSATQFSLLGRCPFQWFAAYGLGLSPEEERDTEVTPLLRGNFFHRTLEEVMHRALEEGIPSQDLQNYLLDHLEEVFAGVEEELGIPDVRVWHAERRWLLHTLRRAIAAPDFLSEGAEVLRVEAEHEAVLASFRIRGKLDRIDREADGSLSVIDYKSGSQKPKDIKDPSGKLKQDIQLALYLKAFGPQLRETDARPLRGFYFLIGKPGREAATPPGPVLEAFLDRARAWVEAGTFPPEPDIDEHACRTCAFAHLCRRGPRLRRKRPITYHV